MTPPRRAADGQRRPSRPRTDLRGAPGRRHRAVLGPALGLGPYELLHHALRPLLILAVIPAVLRRVGPARGRPTVTEVVVPPHDHSAAGVGRRVVAEVCAQAGVAEPETEVAVLLVSELVTNAVVHAHSQPRLTATPEDGGVYVGVTDDSPDIPWCAATTGPGSAVAGCSSSMR